MEFASRARYTAESGNRDKGLQVMQVHLIIRKADMVLQNYAFDGSKPASQISRSKRKPKFFPTEEEGYGALRLLLSQAGGCAARRHGGRRADCRSNPGSEQSAWRERKHAG